MKENDITAEALLFAIRQKNLVYNYNFLYFSNRGVASSPAEYGHPDGWVYSGNGQIGLNQENNSCRIETSTEKTKLSQEINEFPRWEETLKGQTVTAQAHLKLESETIISLSLSDGVITQSHLAQTTGECILVTQIEVSSDAEELTLSIETSTENVVIDILCAYANIGTVAVDTNPCIVEGFIGERKQYLSTETPPAEELSLCESSEELAVGYSRLDSVLNGRFGYGDNKRSYLPDMRGYFSRSWDNGSGTDPDAYNRTNWGKSKVTGDNVGTEELDQFKEHHHSIGFSLSAKAIGDTAMDLVTKGDTSTGSTGGKETRPKNIAELYTIKWA
ncbi:hypothetical protein [Reichenbachiella versicolor]|uniref:hypothetical protein n=1 Tax=Reichenbachiella versicolor TaxID=1821036 RepID=UPI000D6E552A|nr:hypothetical protein [Reichenbachiella versicolor]